MKDITKESVETFMKIHEVLDEKFEVIRKLPMLSKQERDYDGFELDVWNKVPGIVINSSTWYSGCGEDTSSLFILTTELHEPISFFEKKFQDEIDEHKRKVEEKEKLEKARIKAFEIRAKDAEYESYLRLKKKYESSK